MRIWIGLQLVVRVRHARRQVTIERDGGRAAKALEEVEEVAERTCNEQDDHDANDHDRQRTENGERTVHGLIHKKRSHLHEFDGVGASLSRPAVLALARTVDAHAIRGAGTAARAGDRAVAP